MTTPRPQPEHTAAHTRPSGWRTATRGRVAPALLLGMVLLVATGFGLWWWRGRTAEPVASGDPQVAGVPASAPAQPASAAPGTRRFGAGNAVQPVSVLPVRRQDIRVSVNAIGSIAASNTAIVRVQVAGVLKSLNFVEGQQVRQGQWLAQVDSRAFQAALGQAEGTLARDKAQLDNARIDLARYRDLLAKDAIAKQQLDTQEALVRQLEGSAKADQAAVDSARLQLSYARVTAPIAGRVGLKQADIGNVVQPSDANGLVNITQTRPIALVFAVPALHVPAISAKLRQSQPIAVEAWDRGGKTPLATGRVATIDNAIDPGTDTIKVKAVFPNADDVLFPNQAVSVVMQLDTLANVLAVPQAAVLRGAQGFYVYVVNPDNTVGTRGVRPGAVDGGWMAVEGALQPDDKVVVDGTDRLREGARVEVIAADPSKRVGANAPAGAGRRGNRGGGAGAAASAASSGAAISAASGTANGVAGSAASAGARDADGNKLQPGPGPIDGGAVPARGRPRAATGPADKPANAPSTVPGTAPASGAASAAGERPAWMDRLPPEVADRLMKMSPDERREWVRKRREERANRGDAGP